LVEGQPLRQGLAELVAYLQLGSDAFRTRVDENVSELIAWDTFTGAGTVLRRRARLPRVIFLR
jgi:hypothetical protein